MKPWKQKMLTPWKKSYDQPRQHIKKRRHYFANKCPSSQSYGFSSSHVRMWELDYKETECWRIDAFELWCWRRLLRVSWTARRSNQSILKEIQSWIFIGRTDAEADTPILWTPDVKSWLLEKTVMLGKIEGGKRRGQQSMKWLMASPTWWTWVWVSSRSWW